MLKYLQIYCFDTCKTLPIYHIFDEANTFTPIYFSNKDKCLDFHKLNTFFFKFDIHRMPNIILLPILKRTMFTQSTKSIPNLLSSVLSFHAPYHKPFVLFLFNLEPNALPNSTLVNRCSCSTQCSYTFINI
jgi:hypothetical protein